MLRSLKNTLRRRKLARADVAVEIECRQQIYGSGGGAWTLCPDSLTPESVIYSFGVGRNLSFDLDLIARHGAVVHAFDPTPASIEWVAGQRLPERLKFHDYGIGNTDGLIEFHAPRKARSAHFTPIKRYRSGQEEVISAQVKSLRSIMQALGHDRIDLLKMDIEGGEYDVIDNIIADPPPIAQLLVEFHHMYETIPLQKTVDAIARLRTLGLKVSAISERSYEISMINPNV